MKINNQNGFTLVEIAIVLVIIGLLLGGVLKGQELINSARVRNLANQGSVIQAAYYGFIDRFRQVPGDYAATAATQAIGVTINLPEGPDAGNGRLDNTLDEATAVWEQLAKAQFLGGGFTPATAVPGSDAAYVTNKVGPANAFNGALVLSRNKGYSGANPERLNLHMGRNVPVTIARELDIKIDDGLPNTGVLRLTEPDESDTEFDPTQFVSSVEDCTTKSSATGNGNTGGDGVDVTDIYDVFDNNSDCPQVLVY